MIGSLVLQHCLNSPEIGTVVSLTRRSGNISHDKLEEVLISDFLELDETATYFHGIDIVYYCIGVYTGAVDRETFRKITVDYPQTLASLLKNKGSELRFCLLSGAGADRTEKSKMIFARDKGIIENHLAAMGFQGFHSFRPGYIYPVTARDEPNISYKIFRYLYPIIKLFGSNASIKSTELAEAMFKVGVRGSDLEILENRDILAVLR